jgi:hypothetical protein
MRSSSAIVIPHRTPSIHSITFRGRTTRTNFVSEFLLSGALNVFNLANDDIVDIDIVDIDVDAGDD